MDSHRIPIPSSTTAIINNSALSEGVNEELLDLSFLKDRIASVISAVEHAEQVPEQSSRTSPAAKANSKSEPHMDWRGGTNMNDLECLVRQQTICELDEMLSSALEDFQRMEEKTLKDSIAREQAEFGREQEKESGDAARRREEDLAIINERLRNEMATVKKNYDGVVEQLTERVCELTEQLASADAIQQPQATNSTPSEPYENDYSMLP
jgi:hypothetical protein